MRIFKILVVVVSASAVVWLYSGSVERISNLRYLLFGTPHERYAAQLRSGKAVDPAARAWLAAAEQSLEAPANVSLPVVSTRTLTDASAAGFTMTLRRGERLLIDVSAPNTEPSDVFVDLFRRGQGTLDRVASADERRSALDVEILTDGEYVVRVQRRLSAFDATPRITLSAEPTLHLPVDRATSANIQSLFGVARDGGRRQHQGVDIFSTRGTPVVAASDGIVTSVGTNGLGGKVVWILRPGHRERHYYAHLDRQLVSVGTFVSAGDVIGTVGNTGNARTTAPHLHFGIYAAGGAVDPLPYLAPQRIARTQRRTASNVDDES